MNQAEVECCVSCALAGAMETLHPHWPPLAPLFHYFVTRSRTGGADAQGRLFLSNAIETLTNRGICRDADHRHPFTHAGASARPTAAAFADALTRCIRREGFFFAYRRIGGPSYVANIRRHLRLNQPVVLGFTLPERYPDSLKEPDSRWIDPSDPPPSGSHHCVLVIGFDDLRLALRVFDSQGDRRFDNGQWWMGYRIADGALVQEAYALT